MSTAQKKTSQHVYDFAVIGSGLTGLCIANSLTKITSNIILLESSETFGGFNRGLSSPLGTVNNGLRFLPSSDLSLKAISFLEMLLATNLNPTEFECPPVTYEVGGLKPFVGFGDQPPAFYEELSYFTCPRELRLSLQPHEWTQLLFNQYTGDFSPRSFVTKMTGEDGQIQHLTINGQKKINAQNVIYCGPVRGLANILPDGALSIKARTRLAKNKYWTAVCLDLLHSASATESSALHILNGTTQDDLGPCVGRFFNDFSQWMTFVDSEESENTEIIGAALKKVKRQIKRAYPEALENIRHERILVVPEYSGNGEIRLNANQSLPSYSNLWIGSSTLSSQKNLLGSLMQAELVASALGCHPLGAKVETTEMPSEGLSQNFES